MKKIVLMMAMAAVCFSASAALVDQGWSSLFTIIPTQTATGGGPDAALEDGTGAIGTGWYTGVFNLTDSGSAGYTQADVNSSFLTEMYLNAGGPGVSPVLGEYGGYFVDIGTYVATDSDQVQLVLYNNADRNLATAWIVSQTYSLIDAPDIPDVEAVKMNFDFTGSTWQAIPEPATVLLFGIGGFGAWLLRRRQQA